ncbi:MAG TPA: peptidylprolyl isomerase [Pirellulaceae bacterium]
MRQRLRIIFFVATSTTLTWMGFPGSALAQEPATESSETEAEAPADESDDTTAPAVPEANPTASESAVDASEDRDPATTDSAEDFAQVFTAWKSLLKELRDIRTNYALAEKDELEALQIDFDAKIAEGNAFMPRLRAAALAEFSKAPNDDEEVAKLLTGFVADDVKRDDYPAAFALAKSLVDQGAEGGEILNLLGIAAYGSNDFDSAEKYLKEAEAQGGLSAQGETFLASVVELKKLWTEEQEYRAAEAKADDLPRVKLETSEGDIVVELFENEAPETVANFISLVDKGFYDGLAFFRVLPAFMAQGGDPNNDGTGGPGYTIYCECYKDKYRKHFSGSLSMAKEASRNTGGSQFFITFLPTTHLNGKHTVFGRVVEGMAVLPKIQRIDPTDPARKSEKTVITKATVVRKRNHEYVPKKVQ